MTEVRARQIIKRDAHVVRLVAGNSKGADDKPCALVIENKMLMAERVGFEPTVELPPLRFSRPIYLFRLKLTS